jgi:GxxExxY protein
MKKRWFGSCNSEGCEPNGRNSCPSNIRDIPSAPLRIDLLVEELVIVECKATAEYNTIYEAQTLTYLRLMQLRLGLVINFGERLVKDGFYRVANRL